MVRNDSRNGTERFPIPFKSAEMRLSSPSAERRGHFHEKPKAKARKHPGASWIHKHFSKKQKRTEKG